MASKRTRLVPCLSTSIMIVPVEVQYSYPSPLDVSACTGILTKRHDDYKRKRILSWATSKEMSSEASN